MDQNWKAKNSSLAKKVKRQQIHAAGEARWGLFLGAT